MSAILCVGLASSRMEATSMLSVSRVSPWSLSFSWRGPGAKSVLARSNPSLHLTFASRLRRLSPAGELKR